MRKPVYSDYEALIHKQVWSFVKKGMPQEEALSCCHAAFLRARDSWDPAKAKFSTHLTICCFNGLLTESQRFARFPVALDEEYADTIDSGMADPYRIAAVRDAISQLSKEAAEVVRIVLEAPEEMMLHACTSCAPSANRLRVALCRLLHKKHGWDRQRCHAAFDEIRDTVLA